MLRTVRQGESGVTLACAGLFFSRVVRVLLLLLVSLSSFCFCAVRAENARPNSVQYYGGRLGFGFTFFWRLIPAVTFRVSCFLFSVVFFVVWLVLVFFAYLSWCTSFSYL